MNWINLYKIRNMYVANTSPVGSVRRHIFPNYLFCQKKVGFSLCFGVWLLVFCWFGFGFFFWWRNHLFFYQTKEFIDYSKLFAVVLKVIKTVRQRLFPAEAWCLYCNSLFHDAKSCLSWAFVFLSAIGLIYFQWVLTAVQLSTVL